MTRSAGRVGSGRIKRFFKSRGSRPIGSRVVRKITGRVGSGQELIVTGHVGPGQELSKLNGSGQNTLPDPTRLVLLRIAS